MSRIPAGCKCAEDWNATRRIPDICGRYDMDGQGGDDCGTCRHSRNCHPADRTLAPLLARIRRAGEDLERAVRAK